MDIFSTGYKEYFYKNKIQDYPYQTCATQYILTPLFTNFIHFYKTHLCYLSNYNIKNLFKIFGLIPLKAQKSTLLFHIWQ